MNYETIRYEVDAAIATITLNRPERLNAFTLTMARELVRAFDEADADDAVRAVIVTGAGRAFCAGMELDTTHSDASGNVFGLSEGDDPETDPEKIRDSGGTVTLRIFESKKPVIAAINGPAVGIGATMTLAMDYRVAADTAKMGFVFARRGITTEACSSWFLPRIVGIPQALDWVLSGRVFPAGEALAGGLVRSVHPAEGVLAEARRIAREIADNTSAISVALCRQMIWRLSAADHPMAAHEVDSRAMFHTSTGADAKEGIASFLEKRKPEFRSKPSTDMPPFYPWWSERKFR
jgi:enoyl-CoA hydratase/carnithine racemase